MNKLVFYMIISLCGIIAGCNNRKNTQSDLPDIETIYTNISYLDSLLVSKQADSISAINDKLSGTIEAYRNNVMTPDDKVILDSLLRIQTSVNEFLRFCTDSRSNLEILHQDVSSTEMLFKSGKIKTGNYMLALMESEQILVDMKGRFFAYLQ